MKNKITIAITAVALIIGITFGKGIVQLMFAKSDQPPIREVLAYASNKLNATLPMQVDQDTRLDSTIAGPGAVFTYMYTLVNYTGSEYSSVDFINTMKPRLINGYKTNPEMAVYRKGEVALHYYYRDKNGSEVAKIIITPKDF